MCMALALLGIWVQARARLGWSFVSPALLAQGLLVKAVARLP